MTGNPDTGGFMGAADRVKRVMERIGAQPALIHASAAGDSYGEAAPYRIEDGVAIIDIAGPLLNGGCEGCTSYGDIQEQLKQAKVDTNVRGVILNINSPGGMTTGAFETADMVADLGKPCYAVAAPIAYSAAYLIACQADLIYCATKTGGVGSVGVYCAHFDFSEMFQKMGVNVTLISAGEGKTNANPYEPLSKEARAEAQAEIDRLYGEFVGAVAEGRNVEATEVVKMGARIYCGADAAVSAGMADLAGDTASAWVDMCQGLQRPSMAGAKGSAASAADGGKRMAGNTAAEGKVPTAAEIETMVSEARAAGFGTATEIVELCAMVGMPELSAEFITSRKPVAEVRTALMAKRVEKDKAATNGKELEPGITPGAEVGGGQPKAASWRSVLGGLGARLKPEVK